LKFYDRTTRTRIAPANLTVVVTGATLQITGDDALNVLNIDGVPGAPTSFLVSVPAADTISVELLNTGPFGSVAFPFGGFIRQIP